jgi:hypothetical protein
VSDTGDDFRAMDEHHKTLRAKYGALRTKYGVECPECKRQRPRANASILLPQQRCKVDGYRDPRPGLTREQWAVI